MPLTAGVSVRGGDLPDGLRQQLIRLFREVDQAVAERARADGLATSQARLLRRCHVCALVNDDAVFVVLTDANVGGMPRHTFADLRGRPMDLPKAISVVESDEAFEQAFGFTFPRHYADADDNDLPGIARQIADGYLKDEILRLERLSRIVRLNPVFHGRDFLLDASSVFVLSPYEDPFNTIYQDHIKPTVERIEGLRCGRADDIYDNRPIVEDIWRQINEAGIVLAELTGRNPNVFYETGIAHTVGKEVILMTQHMDDVPFDLKHLRCIVYDYIPRGVQSLEKDLSNTIRNIRQRINS